MPIHLVTQATTYHQQQHSMS